MMFLIVFHELTTTDQILSLKIEKKERLSQLQNIKVFLLLNFYCQKEKAKLLNYIKNWRVCVCVQEIAQAEQRKA